MDSSRRTSDPLDQDDDAPVVGLPPRPDDLWTEPTSGDLWGARMLNVFGLVSPLANLGMVQVSRPDMRWTGVLIGIVLSLIGGIAWASDIEWLRTLAFGCHYALVVAGLLHPRWPEAALSVWTRFGELIGKIMSVPMFSLIFYIAVTPVALVMRLFGKDPLDRKAAASESYWTKRESLPTERFHRQY